MKLNDLLDKSNGGIAIDPLIKVEIIEFKEELLEPSDNISEIKNETDCKSYIHCERLVIQDHVQDSSHQEPKSQSSASTSKKMKKVKKASSKAIHEPIDLFCPHCDKLYTRKSILRHHIASVHEKIKRFKCNMNRCEYSCYQKGNLTIHQRNVHNVPGTKTYVCEACGVEYKYDIT